MTLNNDHRSAYVHRYEYDNLDILNLPFTQQLRDGTYCLENTSIINYILGKPISKDSCRLLEMNYENKILINIVYPVTIRI